MRTFVSLIPRVRAGACGAVAAIPCLVPGDALAVGSGTPECDVRAWTPWECSPSHRLNRAAQSKTQQERLAEIAESRQLAADRASAIRAAMIAGEAVVPLLVPDDPATDDPKTVLAWLVHCAEAGAPEADGMVGFDRLLARTDSVEVGDCIKAAMHAAALRALGDRLGPEAVRGMRERADGLGELASVPDGLLARAAAMAELAAVDDDRESRAKLLEEARGSLKRLDAVGEGLAPLSGRGRPFGVDATQGDSVFLLDPALGDELEQVAMAVLERSLGKLGDDRVLRGDLRAVPGAMNRTPAPKRIVVVRPELGGGVGRPDRLLGDELDDRRIALHVVALVQDPDSVDGLAASQDAACELARRSGGSLRVVGRAGLGAAAKSTCIERWKARGMWGPIQDRHRAVIELAISVMDGHDVRKGAVPEALRPLSPDPVSPGDEVGAGADWQALVLAGALRGSGSDHAQRLLQAAKALSAESTRAAARGENECAARLRERAARSLLLRSLVRLRDLSDGARRDGLLQEGWEEAVELKVESGTWSGRLLDLGSGWGASVRAWRSIDDSHPDAALRKWEVALIEHLFRGGGPPGARPAAAGLSPWEQVIFDDCMRSPAGAGPPDRPESTP